MKFETLGRHILVEYYNCDEEVLKNPKLIEEFMNNSALNAKATIVDSVFHHFNPWGVSGAVIIAESHLTIHTWPEYGYAAADFFTCGDIDPWKSFELLETLIFPNEFIIFSFVLGLIEGTKYSVLFITPT